MPDTTSSTTSKEQVYTAALLSIRHSLRSDPPDFVRALVAVRSAYDAANNALCVGGNLFDSPAAEPTPARPVAWRKRIDGPHELLGPRWTYNTEGPGADAENWQSLYAMPDTRSGSTALPSVSGGEPPAAHLTGVEFLHRWMRTPNPLLGVVRPLDMLKSGRGEKLARFIEDAYEANAAAPPAAGSNPALPAETERVIEECMTEVSRAAGEALEDKGARLEWVYQTCAWLRIADGLPCHRCAPRIETSHGPAVPGCFALAEEAVEVARGERRVQRLKSGEPAQRSEKAVADPSPGAKLVAREPDTGGRPDDGGLYSLAHRLQEAERVIRLAWAMCVHEKREAMAKELYEWLIRGPAA